jgi:hypothetical protein
MENNLNGLTIAMQGLDYMMVSFEFEYTGKGLPSPLFLEEIFVKPMVEKYGIKTFETSLLGGKEPMQYKVMFGMHDKNIVKKIQDYASELNVSIPEFFANETGLITMSLEPANKIVH